MICPNIMPLCTIEIADVRTFIKERLAFIDGFATSSVKIKIMNL